jgi:hypothetical protein
VRTADHAPDQEHAGDGEQPSSDVSENDQHHAADNHGGAYEVALRRRRPQKGLADEGTAAVGHWGRVASDRRG